MTKTESIARKILGWKLNRWDRWYDYEEKKFIPTNEFRPEKSMEQAMLIVKKLEQAGYKYTVNGGSKVCFNDVTGTGKTLPEAITNAAYTIIERNSADVDTNRFWRELY